MSIAGLVRHLYGTGTTGGIVVARTRTRTGSRALTLRLAAARCGRLASIPHLRPQLLIGEVDVAVLACHLLVGVGAELRAEEAAHARCALTLRSGLLGARRLHALNSRILQFLGLLPAFSLEFRLGLGGRCRRLLGEQALDSRPSLLHALPRLLAEPPDSLEPPRGQLEGGLGRIDEPRADALQHLAGETEGVVVREPAPRALAPSEDVPAPLLLRQIAALEHVIHASRDLLWLLPLNLASCTVIWSLLVQQACRAVRGSLLLLDISELLRDRIRRTGDL